MIARTGWKPVPPLIGNLDNLEGFVTVAAADVDGVEMSDVSFCGEMTVAAEDPLDWWKLQQHLADFFGAEICLGEIPLGTPGWRQQLAEGQMMNRRANRGDAA